jgi:ATP-dependent DNA helicase RecG
MLLNALVHRTFMGAHIQLRVFDDSLSIWNEGGLPIGLTLSDLKTEHNSRPRNPKIAKACFMAGYIDAWGRGTLKIIQACKEAGLSEPIIEEKNGGIAITIFKKEVGKTSENVQGKPEEVRSKFGANSEQIRSKFGINVEETFNVIAENPGYSAEKIAEKLHISPRTVEKHQAKLKDAGIIERVGSTKSGYWKILI